MRSKLVLHLKPFSINAMYYGDQRIKTREAHEWSAQVFNQLATPDNQAELKKLREHFNIQEQAYNVHLTAYYPDKILFRQDGALSAKAHDLSNWEKPLIDLIFLPKHHKVSVPYGCNNLNVDDKYVTRLSSRKIPAPDQVHRIEIRLAIVRAHPLSRKSDL